VGILNLIFGRGTIFAFASSVTKENYPKTYWAQTFFLLIAGILILIFLVLWACGYITPS
jgi:hypothetical protein